MLEVKNKTLYISYINIVPISIAKGKFLVYSLPISNKSTNLIFIIIIINKNKTVIAPI